MINISWSTLLFQILNFVVMAVILTRFFFKPVIRILDERSKRVTSALDEAENREQEATEMYAEYQRQVAEMQEQVRAARQQAEQELEQTRRRVLDEARGEIQKMREKAKEEALEAHQQAIHQHRLELGRLTTTLSGRLMREAGGEGFQESSIDEFLRRLSALPVDQYRRSLEAGETDVVHVQLVSANELDAETMSRIETQIQEMAGKPVDVRYKVDPALVAGATMRFGDTVIDGSIVGQLQSLNEQYAADSEQGMA